MPYNQTRQISHVDHHDYSVKIIAPPFENPDKPWQLVLYKNGRVKFRTASRMKVDEAIIWNWLRTSLPYERALSKVLLQEARFLLRFPEPREGDFVIEHDRHVLTYSTNEFTQRSPHWTVHCQFRPDSYFLDFIKGVEEMWSNEKPTRSEVEKVMRINWKFDDELIKGLLDKLVEAFPEAFAPEKVTKRVWPKRKRISTLPIIA